MGWGQKQQKEHDNEHLDLLIVEVNRLRESQLALTEAIRELVKGNQETIKFLAQQADAAAAAQTAHAAELAAEHRDSRGRFTRQPATDLRQPNDTDQEPS
jgi:hypothetical protein